jgi:hypothetical protein
MNGAGSRIKSGPLIRTILYLSVSIRGRDDLNFHIPSAALPLHLQSRELASPIAVWSGGNAAYADPSFQTA